MGEWSRSHPIEDVLLGLHRRLTRVEAHLGLANADADPEARVGHESPPRRPDSQPHPPAEPVPTATPTPQALPPVPPPLPVEAPRPASQKTAAFALPALSYQSPAEVEPEDRTELEQTIGLKWAGWVGAIVVVIGAGLGIKYAYDQRWFEILPPAGRLALMSLGGLALLAAGEVVFRRIHRTAAACLFGAGVATLFLVSYAGHGYYRLYEPQTAFVLMALTTAVGAAVAARGDLPSIAVLSQIGGNLAPVLLESDRPLLGSFLAYLVALQVVALAVAWWGGRRWWALRGLSLATTSLWVLAILTDSEPYAVATLVSFSVTCALLYQVELLASALRPRGAPGAAAPAGPTSLSGSMALGTPAGLAAAFSVVVTALLTTALLVILRDASDAARGTWAAGLAAACAAAGYLLSRRRPSFDPAYPLAFAYRVQAAALVVVAVPVAFTGVTVVFGWAVLSLAYAVLGSALDLRISRWAAVMVWRLALLYLGWWTVGPLVSTLGVRPADAVTGATGAHAVWLTLFGEGLRAYTLLAWFLAFVGHTVAWLIHQEGLRPADDSARRFQRLAWVTNALAGVAFITASVAGLPPAGATFAILVYAWLLLGADLLNPRLGLVLQSAVVVALVTIKWLAVDTLAERLAPDWSPTARRPLFNAVMAVGVLISATMGALYWLRRDVLWDALTRRRAGASESDSPAAPALALAAALLALFAFGLTIEIDRIVHAASATLWPAWQLKLMAWTILWTLCLAGFIALARRLEPVDALRPAWTTVAEVLAVLVAVKFLLIDTLGFRLGAGATLTSPLANFQVLTGVVVAGGLALVAYLTTADGAGPGQHRRRDGFPALAGFLAVLVVLWGGSLEIDRAFEAMSAMGTGAFANPARAKMVALSIFWSLFAVASIVAGFGFRTAGLRYFGLGLFAVTLAKVVLFDMSDVQTGYRVLSFLGLGLLLMGTSVLYGKLSPVLLRDRAGRTGPAQVGS